MHATIMAMNTALEKCQCFYSIVEGIKRATNREATHCLTDLKFECILQLLFNLMCAIQLVGNYETAIHTSMDKLTA